MMLSGLCVSQDAEATINLLFAPFLAQTAISTNLIPMRPVETASCWSSNNYN
jgi:hypothetical protein